MSSGPETPAPLRQARPDVLGGTAAVAASHPAISAEGLRVLAEGGNAVDATLAMAAVSWMVLPGQCGIGGDAFATVREPDGRVWTVNGSGFGPDGATPDFFRERGFSALPLGGALSVTVPGAAAALHTLAEHATRAVLELWRRGVELARGGFVCTAKTRADIAEHEASLRQDEGLRTVLLPSGRLPEVGERIRQLELADFLDRLANDLLSFYDGEFADRAISHLVDRGAPFSGREWELGAHAPAQAAVSTSYAGGTLHQTPLPTPGWMMLQQAAVCDGVLTDLPLLGPEAVHWLAEAARQAFRDRLDGCASDNDNWRACLTPEAVAAARQAIGAGRIPGPDGLVRVAGDTTSTVCVDAEGRAVSFIQSLAFTFGARLSVPGTGVALNNRLGRGAYLTAGHPNEVAPRRKPLHTLNAWIFDDEDHGLMHVGNCPGGDGQVQWNMQVLSHLVDHDTGPQAAVSLPRFTLFPGADANVLGKPEELRVEPGLSASTLDRLRGLGHHVVTVPEQVGGPGGSAMAISADHRHGCLRAGADPRMEGVALAL